MVSAFVLSLLTWTTPHHGHAADSRAAESENGSRLHSMPREERLALWEKLVEFDALPAAERSAIQALDARIAKLPRAEQANYRSVLRRYHQWVQGLSEEERNALNSVPPGERMRRVTELRVQEHTPSAAGATPLFLQVIDFTTLSPFDTAHRLRPWFELTPEQRAEIEQLGSPAERQKHLAELGKHLKLGPIHRLTKAEEDALVAKLEANPQMKGSGWLSVALKKADPAKNEKLKRRVAANLYFLEKPPASVEPDRLMRFEAALPSWHRGQFDHLPPEEARRRLTILYRLIFPAGVEMPENTPSPPRRPAPSPSAPRPGAAAGKGKGTATGANPY